MRQCLSLRINAISAARRGGRVNREVASAGSIVVRINAVIISTRRFTRCCDAQGASALVVRINAITPSRS